MLGRLEALKEKHRAVGEVRGKGLLLGMELVKDRASKEAARQGGSRGALPGVPAARARRHDVLAVDPHQSAADHPRGRALAGLAILDEALTVVLPRARAETGRRRGAIVGLGNVAVHGHLPGWLERPDVEIVAVSDMRPAQRAVGAERPPAPAGYDSADSLLADTRLDFVDICTPPSSHARLIRAALERGVHVLCEKPLVRSADELALVTELVRRRMRAPYRPQLASRPIVRLAADLCARVRSAGPRGSCGRRSAPSPRRRGAQGDNWRLDPAVAGGGVLSDHGWHVCYVIQRWLGTRPLAVRRASRRGGIPARRSRTPRRCRSRFPGALAEVLLTWAADERRNWAMIEGESGRIELRDDTLILTAGRPRAAVGPPTAVQRLPSS